MFPYLVFLLCVLFLTVTILYVCVRKTSTESRNSNRSKIQGGWPLESYSQAPGPRPWPIIGNLNILAKYRHNPFEGFTALSKLYGDIYSLKLGQTRCLVVNNLELIREILNQKGKFFGGRPDFLRYNKLFGGDRNNSLALCDWSQLQQKRRNLARRHCSPKESSSFFNKMSQIGCSETNELLHKMENIIVPGESLFIKPLIQQACANMFSQYMCSTRFDYEDGEFQEVVRFFDEIFWEINQGYPLDFLPWLAPLYKKHTNKIVSWSTSIRKFILERIIKKREINIDMDEPDTDFTDALLKSLIEDKNVSRNTIIFMLEDFIGGHSAVGNLIALALAYIVKNPHITKRLQYEADTVSENGRRKINLYDMEAMPYTMATLFEVLRYSSSPIVPHVATEETVISGYSIKTGTVVFINNYVLNNSEKYWHSPGKFNPERFLEKIPNITTQDIPMRRSSSDSDSGVEYEIDEFTQTAFNRSFLNNGNTVSVATPGTNIYLPKYRIKKNIPHFLPFSIGKRTCIGQNLVRGFGFILLANILQKYDLSCKDPSTIKITPACVALPTKAFALEFKPRLNFTKPSKIM